MTADMPIGSSVLTLDAGEVVKVYGALNVLTRDYAIRPLRRLWFGADEGLVPELETRLHEWIVAERAYENSHSAQPRRLTVSLRYAHLVHCSLVLSTEIVSSEEEYKERTGSFREEAIALANAVTGAVPALPAATRLSASAPEPAAPAPTPLPLTVPQARLVHASLVHLLDRAETPAIARLWLGVHALEGARFAATLADEISAAEESGARRVPLDAEVAHPGYCALVLATRLIQSEAAYYDETGRFKDDAHKAGIDIMRPMRMGAAGDQ
jgi:hypothetical protein